jgi:hypothetical protein
MMVVFIPTRDGQLPAEQSAGNVSRREVLPRSTNSTNATPRNSESDQKALPLWTWFIENPRSCGA